MLRLILQQQARVILLGSAAGLSLAVALGDVMSSLLYGVKPHDFTTFALSWIILTAIALLASAAESTPRGQSGIPGRWGRRFACQVRRPTACATDVRNT